MSRLDFWYVSIEDLPERTDVWAHRPNGYPVVAFVDMETLLDSIELHDDHLRSLTHLELASQPSMNT